VAAVNDTDAALAALSPPLAKLGGRSKLRIWLSGGLCRPFIVPAVPGIRGTVEWQRTAAALAPQRTGLAGPCRVWVDAVKGDAPRVAVVMQESWFEQLMAFVEANRTRGHSLASIRPWWADVLRAAHARDPQLRAMATQDCDSLTVLVSAPPNEGGFSLASTLTPVTDRDAAESALARLLLSADVDAAQSLTARLIQQPQEPADAAKAGLAMSALTEWSR